MLAQAVKQATSTAVAAVKPLQGIGAVDKVRTMVVDRFAAVSNRLAALYAGAVRDAAGKTNALAIARQAEDVQKIIAQVNNELETILENEDETETAEQNEIGL